VLTLPDRGTQIVLVDTPGIHKPRTALGERLNTLVYGSLADADVVLFLLDALRPVGPGDRLIAARLKESGTPVIVIVNKVDRATPDQIGEQLVAAGEWDFDAYVPISALKRGGIDIVVDEVVSRLEEGPWFFPEDAVTDQPDQLLAAELIREKFLSRLREELPHSLAVVVHDIEVRDNGVVHVEATAYVERESQKGMVIGKGGSMVKEVGKSARYDLEKLFGAKVYLDLNVRVEKDWQQTEEMLDRLGF
jgi:GTP-binding protein Era